MAKVATHLVQVYSAVQTAPGVKESVEELLVQARQRVIEALTSKKTHVATRPSDLAPLIEKRQANQQTAEDNLREFRLREALKLKQELEHKLEHIQENIKSLEAVSEPETHKSAQMDSEARKEYYREEERRRQETAEFAKKLRAEQLELARRNRLREGEMQHKLQQELALAEKRKEEEEVRLQEERAQRLEELQERARKRKADLEQRRKIASEESGRIRAFSYAHERMSQENFRTPQEQEMLAKKKLEYQPIKREDLQEHARKHDEIMREMQRRKEAERHNQALDSQINALPRASAFTHSVLEQEKKVKEEAEQAGEARRKLQEKKQRYAMLVKEMFAPAVDPLKRKEMEMIKEKLAVSHLPKVSTARSLPSEPILFNPPKFKENPMVPKPPPKREAKFSDFLLEKRQNREKAVFQVSGNLDLDLSVDPGADEEHKAQLLKVRTEKLERQAKRRELLLSQASPTSSGALDAHENLNDALITSIKAKLSLLK